VGNDRPDFAEFYRDAKDDCLRTVLVSVGDRETAQDLPALPVRPARAAEPGLDPQPAAPAGNERRVHLHPVYRRPGTRLPVGTFAVQPARLPSGAGLQLGVRLNPAGLDVHVGLVDATPNESNPDAAARRLAGAPVPARSRLPGG
jgi:hypothetical protein